MTKHRGQFFRRIYNSGEVLEIVNFVDIKDNSVGSNDFFLLCRMTAVAEGSKYT